MGKGTSTAAENSGKRQKKRKLIQRKGVFGLFSTHLGIRKYMKRK